MAPIPLWSGNLRLSLVLVPVKMFPAVSTEGTIAFRMIHEPSGKPIRYLKGVETEKGFKEVPEDEIIKGYEHTKGHHVLIKPEELNDRITKLLDERKGLEREIELLKKAAAGGALQNIRSLAGFERRLNDMTCSGCHQTRGIGGFHFPGVDWMAAKQIGRAHV